jgi:dipeptidyl aminopeptidase/acylaminoacyl peptidase
MTHHEFNRRQLLFAAGVGIVANGTTAAPARAAPASASSRPRNAVLIQRRLLFGDLEKSVVRISPDGTRIAFLAPVAGVLNLWVGPIGDVMKARPITKVTDRNLGPWLVWLPNNRHVAFFRDQGGDENWQTHRVDLETGEIIALTPAPGVTCYVHQVSHHFPDELLIAHNQRDKRFFEIYRVNAATGASTRIQDNDRFAGFFTDPQFRVRLAQRFNDDGSYDYLERAASGEWEPFAHIDAADTMGTRPYEFSDDGKELYWLDSRERDKAAVVAQDLTTGAMRVLAEDAKADATEIALAPQTYRPIAGASMFARKRWQVIDRAYAADYAALAKISTGDLAAADFSDDRRNWVVYYERDVAPGQYFHFDRAKKRARLLFTSRPALENAPLVKFEPVVVRARDGLDLVCYLSRPRGAVKGTPTPMVLVVHGGPWFRDNWGLNSVHQWLANRGYAVLSVNYRGSTGFGKSFVNAANLEWGGKMHDDLIDAVDWAIAQGIAERERIAIYGGSYGGYAALVGATFTPEKFACAIDVVGISNLMTFINTIPDYWKPSQTLWKTRMGDYTTEAGRKFLEERSPLNHVDRIVRPLLIAQGANDPRVKASESDQIVKAMEQRRIPVTYLYYSDEGHGFRRPENRRSFYAVAEAFLAKHLGGRFEPVGDDFAGSTIEFKSGRDLIPGLG